MSKRPAPGPMLLTATQLARFCKVSAGLVTSWCDEGMPCERTGRMGAKVSINLRDAVPWIVQKRSARLTVERDKLAAAQTEKFQLENARRRGQLAEVVDVLAMISTAAADLVGQLEGLPGRLANELAGISDADIIRQRLLAECRAIRLVVADSFGKVRP